MGFLGPSNGMLLNGDNTPDAQKPTHCIFPL